jgi:hypothetical protein
MSAQDYTARAREWLALMHDATPNADWTAALSALLTEVAREAREDERAACEALVRRMALAAGHEVDRLPLTGSHERSRMLGASVYAQSITDAIAARGREEKS